MTAARAPRQCLAKVTLASFAVMSSSKPQMKSQQQLGPSESLPPTAAPPPSRTPRLLLPELYLPSEVWRWGVLTLGLQKQRWGFHRTADEQMGFNTQEALMAY